MCVTLCVCSDECCLSWHQVLSPLSTGLFHRAITESGTAAIINLYSPDPKPTAMVIIKPSSPCYLLCHGIYLCTLSYTEHCLKSSLCSKVVSKPQGVASGTNCEGTKPDQIVDCVMRMTAEDVVKLQQEVRHYTLKMARIYGMRQR